MYHTHQSCVRSNHFIMSLELYKKIRHTKHRYCNVHTGDKTFWDWQSLIYDLESFRNFAIDSSNSSRIPRLRTSRRDQVDVTIDIANLPEQATCIQPPHRLQHQNSRMNSNNGTNSKRKRDDYPSTYTTKENDTIRNISRALNLDCDTIVRVMFS